MTSAVTQPGSQTSESSNPVGRCTDPPFAPQVKSNLGLGRVIAEKLSFEYIVSQHGQAYVVKCDDGNTYVYRISSRKFRNVIREMACIEGISLRKQELTDIIEMLSHHAEEVGERRDVFYRVAPIEDGIEIDCGDANHTRIRVTAGKVEIIKHGSQVFFERTGSMEAMVMPAERGDLNRLRAYVNFDPVQFQLFIAWLSYTLAHPKISSTKYQHLVLMGDQGTGKSLIARLIIALIDPSRVGLQAFPKQEKDLVAIIKDAHLRCFDNMRSIRDDMADLLCIASTGGASGSRALYTDSDLHVDSIHGPLVLNSIHRVIEQSDLAQRCLCLQTQAMPESSRKSEGAMMREFEADLPFIFRGLLDVIAEVQNHLSDAEIVNPERMLDFVRWLAAMEKAKGIQSGIFQIEYSQSLRQGQLDSLLDNLLAATLLQFAETALTNGHWRGTPSGLLDELESRLFPSTIRSADWPKNPIALSKRLNLLKADLFSQGIQLEFSRGKNRLITLTNQNFKNGE